APSGHYAFEANYFASSVKAGPLTFLADGQDGGNGLYRYGTSGFPTNTYRASNYWVDVVFTTTPPLVDTTPPAVSSFAPKAGASDVSTEGNVTVIFSEPVDPATISGNTLLLRDGSNNQIQAIVTYNPVMLAATLTPVVPLSPSTTYTAV